MTLKLTTDVMDIKPGLSLPVERDLANRPSSGGRWGNVC